MMTDDADPRSPMLPHLRAGFWLVVLVVAPTLLTMTLLSRPKAGKVAIALQNRCLIWAIVVASIATADWLRARSERGSTFAMLTAGASGLIIFLILWNKLFRHYIAKTGFTDNTFRSVFHTIYAPLYGRVQFAKPSWWLVLICAAALLLLWELSRNRPAIWRIALAQLVLTVGFAGTESILRIQAYFAEFRPFESDLQKFSGISDLMAHYVQRMPQLAYFDTHYPPGFLLIFMAGKWAGTHLLAKGLAILLPVLAIFPLRALARELVLSEKAAALAAALFVSSAGILIFPTITPTGAMVFLSCSCLWLLVRASTRGDWFSAAAFGLCFAVYVFFSFASYMLAIVMGMFLLIALINGSISRRRAAGMMGIAIATFVLFFLCLYFLFHFDIIACFRMASAMHLKSPGHGFDDPVRYLFRSTGGILAYLISTSFALAILPIPAAQRHDNQPGLRRAFVLGTLLGILLAGFSGMSFLETERIWLIFTPALAVAAGAELERREREDKWATVGVLLFALTFSCAYELVFRHHLSAAAAQG
jgi:hypothetical protein